MKKKEKQLKNYGKQTESGRNVMITVFVLSLSIVFGSTQFVKLPESGIFFYEILRILIVLFESIR